MAFFQGSLQEGIAAALQHAKSVVPFVTGERVSPLVSLLQANPRTDGGAESKQWEDDFFAEEEVSRLKLPGAFQWIFADYRDGY
jgi:hypothetical protein